MEFPRSNFDQAFGNSREVIWGLLEVPYALNKGGGEGSDKLCNQSI